MLHTEGGHFALDESDHLVVYNQTLHETSVTGVTETGERFNNRTPRKLTNRLLIEANPVSGKRGEKDFDLEFPNLQHFNREQDQPFPDAKGNVWIVWDAATSQYIPSSYGVSRNLKQSDIDNVEYLFYRYDDQGPEWDWGGPEGAGGGVLVPCADVVKRSVSEPAPAAPVAGPSSSPVGGTVVVAPMTMAPASTTMAVTSTTTTKAPTTTKHVVTDTTTAAAPTNKNDKKTKKSKNEEDEDKMDKLVKVKKSKSRKNDDDNDQ
jgi:hypothetical protein